MASSNGEDDNGPPEVSSSRHHGESKPLRDLPSKPWNNETIVHEHQSISPAGATTPRPDGALQTSTAAPSPAAATTGTGGFPGVGDGNGLAVNSAPPDTSGAVGRTQYVQWVNTSLAVFDKSTGAMAAGFPKQGNTLWTGFILGGGAPGCENNNDGDPIVQYDKAADRWVLTQFSVTNPGGTGGFQECVAVSQTSDATGAYWLYSFSYGNVQFNDYPKLGIWPDGYYLSYNIFNNGSAFAGSKVCALDRAKMLTGAAATQECFQLSSSFGGLLPSDLDGATPPAAGTPNAFVSFGANTLNIWKFHADFGTPANASLTGPASLPVAAFSQACSAGPCVRQSGTSQRLDSLGDRLMYRLAYRNMGDHGAWVVTHSVTTPNSTGVRWYELRDLTTAPSVFQQGTYAPDADFRWMGSAAMDHSGNIAVGYSLSSPTRFPSIAYAARAPTDPLGTLGPQTIATAGTGSQLTGLSRWGDYSDMTIDPVDDCTFWYTNEYLRTSGTFNWSTSVTHFTVAGCSTAPPPPPGQPSEPLGLVASPGNNAATLSWSPPSSNGGAPVTSYNVYRGTAPGAEDPAPLASSSTTSYTDTTATNGPTYYYKVRAVNSSSFEGPPSAEASATPAPSTPPDAPTGLTATPGNARVTLAWSAPASTGTAPISSYRVYRGVSGATPTLLTSTASPGFTNTGLVNGTTYAYAVSAVSSAGEGPLTAPASATPAGVPGAPTGLTGGPASPRGVALSWNPPASNGGSAISGYQLFRSTSSGREVAYLAPVACTSTPCAYTDTGTTAGTRFFYQVAAVNASGTGARSGEVRVRAR